ncbi:MAG: TetR/AcrR family transcriptional regulator [Bacilli bacterium]|nr:TetR/AcrR family transcriptional regulator [Bacilli bacterium]
MELQSNISKKYLAEALILLMKKKDYNKITNKDITDKAGLSHITYYRNFKNKEEIIKYYLDEITNEFIKSKKVNYNPAFFKDYIITLFTHLKEKEDIGLLLYKANCIHFIKDEFDKIFYNKAKNKKEEYNYRFIAGGLYNVYYSWLINGCIETPKEIALMFLDFFKH